MGYTLMITQAAAYIANRLPLVTVSAYLRLFHESESKRTRPSRPLQTLQTLPTGGLESLTVKEPRTLPHSLAEL
jgi:hypothetical protein